MLVTRNALRGASGTLHHHSGVALVTLEQAPRIRRPQFGRHDHPVDRDETNHRQRPQATKSTDRLDHRPSAARLGPAAQS